MKKLIAKIAGHYKKLSFLQGMTLAICFTSLFSIAATNLPGLYIFSAGAPISSSEINANFEKLAGSTVLKVSLTTALSANGVSFIVPSDCPTCNVYRKKINFDAVAISDGNFLSATDTDPSYSSYNSAFKYYKIPSDGWYEIRFLANLSASESGAICEFSGCSLDVSASANVAITDSISSAAGDQNTYSVQWLGVSKSLRDNNYDLIFDAPNSYPGQLPEIKRVFLKTGQVVHVRFNGNYSQTNASGTSFSVGISGIELTIIKL